MTEQTLTLRIIVEKPVPGIVYGLQKGSGNDYEILQKHLSDTSDLLFDIAIPLKKNKEGNIVLHGPFIQEPPNGKFLYLDIGSYAEQYNAPVSGRLKVPLTDISEELIGQAVNRSVLVTKFPGTNSKDGRPNTGTVKPFSGWTNKKQTGSGME
jgi:hypothetical protein